MKRIYAFLVLASINLNASQVTMWHAFDSKLGEIFSTYVDEFNQAHKDDPNFVPVVLENKGSYDQTLEAFLKENPDTRPEIVQGFEMATVQLQRAKNLDGSAVYLPISQFMKAKRKFIAPIYGFYKSRDNGVVSLPFNASTVVFYYNKTLLDKHGLKVPTTWNEFEVVAKKLSNLGEPAKLAAGWTSGHHVDQIGAIENKAFASHGNGLDSADARLVYEGFFVRHLQKLQNWYKKGWFSTAAGPAAEEEFSKGEVVFLSQGANRLPNIRKVVEDKFEIGVAYFPHWKRYGNPYNTIAGGSSFWVTNHAFSEPQSNTIGKFLEYLSTPELQARWQRETGYIPVVPGAMAINEHGGFGKVDALSKEAAIIGYKSYTRRKPGTYSRGILLDKFPAIRKIVVDQMLKAIKGEITPEEAVRTWIQEGNKILEGKKD